MGAVYARLFDALRPGGYLFVYQLTSDSYYQKFHELYRREHPHGRKRAPYMEFEDSERILESSVWSSRSTRSDSPTTSLRAKATCWRSISAR